MTIEDDDQTVDTVGYCRPPNATQFKKGRSGNPAGRPKKAPTETPNMLERALAKIVQMSDGDHIQSMTALEAILRQTVRRALAGSLPAAESLLKLRRHVDETPEESTIHIVNALPE